MKTGEKKKGTSVEQR